MLKNILSIAGRPGLFRLVNRGKNMLIVESISTGKRMPAYAHDKVISLGDVTMYADSGDVRLNDVLESVKKKADAKAVDVKAIGKDENIREYFAEILPDFDRDRVYTSDIKKLLSWYNQLIAAGITDFSVKEEEKAEDTPAEE